MADESIRVSYAQNGEDVRAWRALRDVEEIFYVEVGASHPFDDSVTAALNAEGGRGLLIEPDPEAAALLRRSRPTDTVVAVAAHSHSGLLHFVASEERGRATVTEEAGEADETVVVPAARLTDLLDAASPSAIHFMSIDVEGHEREALEGLDLTRWRPWILCVEATAPGSRERTHDQWEHLLDDASYAFVAFDGLNRWYVPEERQDLMERVAEPFGVLDEMLDSWRRREMLVLHDEVAAREEQVRALQEQLRSSQGELSTSRSRVEELEHLLSRSEERYRGLEAALSRTREAAASAEATALAELERIRTELEHAIAMRSQAEARERVLLESKSWRLTAPLRRARASLGRGRSGALVPSRQIESPQHPGATRRARPGDERRRRALLAKIEAARMRQGST